MDILLCIVDGSIIENQKYLKVAGRRNQSFVLGEIEYLLHFKRFSSEILDGFAECLVSKLRKMNQFLKNDMK